MPTNIEKLRTMSAWLQYEFSTIPDLHTLKIPKASADIHQQIKSTLATNNTFIGLITDDAVYLIGHVETFFMLVQPRKASDFPSSSAHHQQGFLRDVILSVYQKTHIIFKYISEISTNVISTPVLQIPTSKATNTILRNALTMAIANHDLTTCMHTLTKIMHSNQAYQQYRQTGQLPTNVRVDYLLVALIANITQIAISAGLNADYVYTISDQYLHKIETIKSPFVPLIEEFMAELFTIPERSYRTPVSMFRYLVQQNIFEKISVSTLADQIGISGPQLRRLIKEDLNTTPLDYINEQKILTACTLLSAEHNLKIFEVAERLQYYDTSHFTREFVKYTQITPKEFQKFTKF